MSKLAATAAVCLAVLSTLPLSAVAAAAPGAQEAAPLHIPLVRRKLSPRSVDDFAALVPRQAQGALRGDPAKRHRLPDTEAL